MAGGDADDLDPHPFVPPLTRTMLNPREGRGPCLIHARGFLDAREASHLVMATVSLAVSFADVQHRPPATSRVQTFQVGTEADRDG